MAINRTPGSLFDSLKEISIETETTSKNNQQNVEQNIEDHSLANDTKKPKTTSIKNNKPKSTSLKRNMESQQVSSSIKAFDFGEEKEKKETKSVRKQFVFTPTYAKWLNETAKLNNISENLVIERLMERAMHS